MKFSFYPSAPFRSRRGGSLRGQMMKMLRDLGLAVLVVCIAAFASGCGGGGGGGATEEMPPPVMECPQGQVGTYPDCTDPGPTDEERIAEARETIVGIVNEANTIEQAARSAVTAVETSADATVEQIANARAEGNAALDALRAIVRASGTANSAATTPAAAEGAVTSANAALGRLRNAQSAAARIQSDVQAVANLREQEAEEDRLATNGSRLIQHVRDNKKVYDEVLDNLGPTSITVGLADPAANGATYPFHTGTTRTVYPQPQDAERGVLRVTVTVGGTAISSTGQTPKLSGTGRLSQALDVKDGSRFANAYTDIAVDRRVGTGNPDVDNTPADERYEYAPDADYLLAGFWLDDTTANPSMGAFAYGNENITTDARAASLNRCSATQEAGDNTCAEATGFHQITNFVSDGRDLTATYRGNANGAYLAGGMASYFTADVELTALFRNLDGSTVTGSNISGEVTNITAGGKSIKGSIDLIRHPLGNDISGQFTDTTNGNPAAVGVIAGENYSGRWTGRFFGKRTKSSPTAVDNTGNDGRTYTYQPDAPNSVAGSFYVIKQSAPAGDAAFLGSFATYR